MTIRNLQHFSMTVPDLEIARVFYQDFGLHTFYRDGTLVCRCFGRDQDQIILTQGPRKRLSYVSYGTDSESLAGVRQRLEHSGIALLDAPANVPGDGLWFRDFDGMLTNIKVAAEAPWDTAPRVTFNTLTQHTARSGRSELFDERPTRHRRISAGGWRFAFWGHAGGTVVALIAWLCIPARVKVSEQPSRTSGLMSVLRSPWPYLLGIAIGADAFLHVGVIATLAPYLQTHYGADPIAINAWNIGAMVLNALGCLMFGKLL